MDDGGIEFWQTWQQWQEAEENGCRSLFLMRKKNPKTAHMWLGNDTACRMYSTGGLVKSKYSLSNDKQDLRICQMCINKSQEKK